MVKTPYNGKWYARKRPTLAISILELFALDGKHSRKTVQIALKRSGGYKEIFEAFESLENKNLIRRLPDETGEIGRPSKIFAITEHGMKVILEETKSSKIFWQGILALLHTSQVLSLEHCRSIIDDLWHLFNEMHIHYQAGVSFFICLEYFDKLCKRWIKKKDHDELEYKILKSLSSKTWAVIDEIARDTGAPPRLVQKRLKDMSHPPKRDPSRIGLSIDKSIRFWQSCLVVSRKVSDRTKEQYRLSEIGLLLLLRLEIKKSIINKTSGEQQLFDFAKLIDELVSQDPNKFPLIFGKWDLLKKTFSDYAAYNFGFVTDRDARSAIFSKSILGYDGIAELLDDVNRLAEFRHMRLEDFINDGLTALQSYLLNPRQYDFRGMNFFTESSISENTVAVYDKLLELMAVYGDVRNVIPSKKFHLAGRHLASDNYQEKYKKQFISEFAQGATLLYFLALMTNYFTYASSLPQMTGLPMPADTPREAMQKVLLASKDISNFTKKWLEEIKTHRKQTGDALDELGKFILSKDTLSD